MGHAALENVYEEIGFDQNLIIDAVDIRVRVVMADEIADALRLPMGITARGQHFECDGRAFHLLVRAVAVTVFFKAHTDADIMRNGGSFQNFFCRIVHVFALRDGLCEREHLQKVVDALDTAALVLRHFQNELAKICHVFHFFLSKSSAQVKRAFCKPTACAIGNASASCILA